MGRTAKIALVSLVMGAAYLPGTASACPGRFAETYLFWQSLPELTPNEVAVEVDVRSAMQRPRIEDVDGNTDFRVSRVVVGDFDGEIIKVQLQSTSCTRELAGAPGTTMSIDRLILVGQLEAGPRNVSRLIPRYMTASEAQQYGLSAAARE